MKCNSVKSAFVKSRFYHNNTEIVQILVVTTDALPLAKLTLLFFLYETFPPINTQKHFVHMKICVHMHILYLLLINLIPTT